MHVGTLRDETIMTVVDLEPSHATTDLSAVTGKLSFPAQPSSPAKAREFADLCLDMWELAALADPVDTIVSELVTNACMHTKTPWVLVTLYIDPRENVLCIEVLDYDRTRKSDPSTWLSEPDPLAEGGRGLWLVAHMAAASWTEFAPDAGYRRHAWVSLTHRPR